MRLLDNDELSPEEVNDVKDFLDDYVERNQVCLLEIILLKKLDTWVNVDVSDLCIAWKSEKQKFYEYA